MSTARAVEIAEAVVGLINGRLDFDQPYAHTLGARRGYVPVYELKSLSELRVTVVPRTRVAVLEDRAGHERLEWKIDIGVQRRIGLDIAKADQLVRLCEQIGKYLLTAKAAGASATDCSIDPLYDPDHFERLRQFTSVVTMTYAEVR